MNTDDDARVRVYGLGAAKTGTHSLARMFEDVCEAAHEADAGQLIRHLIQRDEDGNSAPLRASLRRRDARRGLAVDSSQVNLYLLEELESLFDGNRYVMTVRHPVHWLRSIIDDSLRRDVGATWHAFRDLRFGRRASPWRRRERVLARRGLHTLDGYLGYWRESVVRPPRRLPADRLLTVRTDDLQARASEIADFAGLPRPVVTADQAHAFANPHRFGVLDDLPRDHLLERLEVVCGEAVDRYFPDLPIPRVLDQVLGA